jgi:hypothetical protein
MPAVATMERPGSAEIRVAGSTPARAQALRVASAHSAWSAPSRRSRRARRVRRRRPARAVPSGAKNGPSTSAACSNDDTSKTWLPMCACTPTSSTAGHELERGDRLGRAPEATEKPNLESSCPVRTNSWVWASTPGVTRTRTFGRSAGPGGDSSRRPRRAISSNESTTIRPTPSSRAVPAPRPTCCCRAGPGARPGRRRRGRRGARRPTPHRGACPPREPGGPWRGRGTPWWRRPPRRPTPRPPPGRRGAGGPRRRRRGGAELRRQVEQVDAADPQMPVGPTAAVRGSRCRSTGAVATSWSVGMVKQDTAASARPGRGGETLGCRTTTIVPCSRPRSSADRAPASGAGGAGSSPAGGARAGLE